MTSHPSATAVESAPVQVSRAESEQIRAIADLAGGDAFVLSETPRGPLFTSNGRIGQIAFEDGSRLDILPSMPAGSSGTGRERALSEMLCKVFGISAGRTAGPDLFEFFVMVFADDVNRLINKGLRSMYTSVSGNEKSFKGRIMFNEHIRRNYIHKERIYVEYELYSKDRPENRLIKSTVAALLRRTADGRNSRRLKTILMAMEEIPESPDVDRDFGKISSDRNMVDYGPSLMWCSIFLQGMRMGGSSGARFCYAFTIGQKELCAAYVARMSSAARRDGSFRLGYRAEAATAGDVSSVTVSLRWSFYDRATGSTVTDAEFMYKSAPGYRPIPHCGGDTIKAMAGSYLSDAFR